MEAAQGSGTDVEKDREIVLQAEHEEVKKQHEIFVTYLMNAIAACRSDITTIYTSAPEDNAASYTEYKLDISSLKTTLRAYSCNTPYPALALENLCYYVYSGVLHDNTYNLDIIRAVVNNTKYMAPLMELRTQLEGAEYTDNLDVLRHNLCDILAHREDVLAGDILENREKVLLDKKMVLDAIISHLDKLQEPTIEHTSITLCVQNLLMLLGQRC
jgi:hypothetical protein